MLPNLQKQRTLRQILPFLVFALTMLFTACGGNTESKNGDIQQPLSSKPGDEETTTIGDIRIGVDETLQPIIAQEIESFMALYPKANIEAWYKPEGLVVQDLLNDSIRLAILGRELFPEEAAVIRRAQIRPKSSRIGKDAIALVMHPENPLDTLTWAQLSDIMQGKVKSWEELGSEIPGDISIVFDDPRSSTVTFVRQRFLSEGDSLPNNAYTGKSHDGVFDYVARSKRALGLVGLAWIADRDDAQVRSYLENVKLVRMESPDSSDLPGVFVQPYQNEVILNRYPLSREIWAVSREHFTGLGTGFVVFLAGERGQRILLKAGLVPEYMQPRFVDLPEKAEESDE